MKTYYVVNAELSFGFGGFVKKAFLTKEEAERALNDFTKRNRNVTDCNITVVEANNKKEAESNRPSMFKGEFAGIDGVRI